MHPGFALELEFHEQDDPFMSGIASQKLAGLPTRSLYYSWYRDDNPLAPNNWKQWDSLGLMKQSNSKHEMTCMV